MLYFKISIFKNKVKGKIENIYKWWYVELQLLAFVEPYEPKPIITFKDLWNTLEQTTNRCTIQNQSNYDVLKTPLR